MTQDERWLHMWQQYMDFLHKNKRRPSKYKPEDRSLVNWAKHNRKLINQHKCQPDRMDKFNELMREAEKYHRINQHAYMHISSPSLFD